MKKPDTKLDIINEIEEKEAKPSKKFITPNFLKRKPKNNLDPETTDETSVQSDEEDSEPPHKKIQIPIKLILIILGISVVASILLIFIFDWTGWKTSLRDDLTTKLLGKEKEIITARLEFEYENKLNIAKEEILKEERSMLVTEYQELEKKKIDFGSRMNRLENSEILFEQEKTDLITREFELEKKIKDYDNGIIEVAELGKIYQAMEPKNAAKILGSIISDEHIIKILKTMKTDSVAAILELMETQKAADILSKIN